MNKRLSRKHFVYIIGALGIISVPIIGIVLSPRSLKEPIRVGFLGEFSAHLADWTIACRDGAVLRIEEINATGGIQGRAIELIVKDADEFKDNPTKAVDQLVQAGVVAIIGPISSTAAMQIVPYANSKHILLVSPSASTNALSNQDDSLIRVTQTQVRHSRIMATYLFEKLGWRKITGTFTTMNRTFVEEVFNSLKEKFEQLGGRVILGELISENADSTSVARSLVKDHPDGIFVVGHALAVANMCEELRKIGARYQIATSGVAHTQDLIQHGGDAVEGIVFALTFLEDEAAPGFKEFKSRYLKRFGKAPFLPDVYGYEAATVLTEALKQSHNFTPGIIKQTILKIKVFPSPISPEGLIINEFGDVERNVIIVTVKNGRFVRVK